MSQRIDESHVSRQPIDSTDEYRNQHATHNRIDNYMFKELDKLKCIEGTKLFYPCSGNDLITPIEIFSPYITDFWFVDRGYFSSGHQDTRYYGFDAPADRQEPILNKDKRYKFIAKTIIGMSDWDRKNRDIEPCILTETYRHIGMNKEIRIHRRRGYGYSAFRHENINPLGVFFYRGDSAGEGGSGNLWLKQERIESVCSKIIDGGLFVSDGSDGSMYRRRSGVYREIYRRDKPSADIHQLIKSRKSFTDKGNRVFFCVGYAGDRYGPTMIWQIMKA
jgi:hypothetical protein